MRLTYEDYRHFPEDNRYELIDGEAYVLPSQNRRHQQVLGNMLFAIAQFLELNGGGEVLPAPFDVVLSDHDVLQPDIVFIAAGDMEVLTEENVWGTPTWIIEVLLPSTRHRDRGMKLERYEWAGVPEVWLADPEEHVLDLFVLQGGRYEKPSRHGSEGAVRPRSLPAFELDLAKLFGSA